MKREEFVDFGTGAVREDKRHKPRPDLICTYTEEAVGYHMAHGAVVLGHGERNWEKGIPDTSFAAGISRHWMHLRRGDCDEDHASAMIFGLMGLRLNAELGREELQDSPCRIFTLDMWRERMKV